MKQPSLQPMVEIYPGEPSWVVTPDQPWPQLVFLSGRTPPSDVALVVYMLSTYGRTLDEGPRSPTLLASSTRLVLPGGLLVMSEHGSIAPSCCSGLESWLEWRGVLRGTGTPWLGHDPSPFVESSNEGVTVWPDGGLGEARPAAESSIHFTHEEFRKAFGQAEYDFASFLEPLRSWCDACVPESSLGISAAFQATFLATHPNAPNPSLQRTRYARR